MTTEPDSPPFDTWALVEVMGHHAYAGRVTEQRIGGATFIRVDVLPADETGAGYTKLLGASSIFAITPLDEETARRAARQTRTPALGIYLPPEPRTRALGAGEYDGPVFVEPPYDDVDDIGPSRDDSEEDDGMDDIDDPFGEQ